MKWRSLAIIQANSFTNFIGNSIDMEFLGKTFIK